MRIEVVVVTHNSARHIGPCVDSICAAGAKPIVVDNGSTDDTSKIVKSKSAGTAWFMPTGENLGYGRAMNIGFRQTTGEFVILSNPDVVFLGDSIPYMAEFLRTNPQVGILGVQEVFPDGSWQRSYGDLPGIWCGIKDAVGITTLHNQIRRALWPRKLDRKPKEVGYPDGAVLAVRREAFVQADGFEEEFYFYSDESDLSARMQKMGWKIMFSPESQVMHIRGADSAKRDRSERYLRYMAMSQHLLAATHLPRWKARLYSRLQICHFVRLGLIYRIRQWFGGDLAEIEYKRWMFSTYTRIWKELCRTGRSSRGYGAEPIPDSSGEITTEGR
jgi:N-acetylglucosaminyl-diphospho-decaprenol L-rhamnosyltransferase